MVPSSNTESYPVIFDGSDQRFSFTDFLRRVAWSSDWIALLASVGNRDMEYLIPSRLYGDALRYYENLDLECQQDFEQLQDALRRRFPGVVRSGGIVRHSAIKWDQSGLATSAEAPPLPVSHMALPASEVADDEERNRADNTGKRASKYLKNLRNTIVVPSIPFLRRTPTPVRPRPPLTVRSFLIEEAHGGSQWKPSSTTQIISLDMSDEAVLEMAKKIPLTVIPTQRAINYRVGFAYSVHFGELSFSFRHHVLEPKQSRIMHSRVIGKRLASPEGMGAETYPLSDFLAARTSWNRNQFDPGTYVIKSSIESWSLSTSSVRERDEIGAITWKIELR